MMKVTSKGRFDTSFGDTFVIEEVEGLKIGEDVSIDGHQYKIKKVIMNYNFSNKLGLVVE